ncbi:MAG: hypothetical protein ACI4F0_06395 [Agathobacter sp.]
MTYKDLQVMFGPYYPMPSEAYMKGDVIEYRCPYIPKCPARAKCFATATPEPLQDNDVLNVKCRLCGNKKIPVYARCAANVK